ncbi:MAG: hypothetical protein J5772_03145 [Clostridia bacterium]|nr:hypothetical protein [Clostridia bacterium]
MKKLLPFIAAFLLIAAAALGIFLLSERSESGFSREGARFVSAAPRAQGY